MSKPVAWRRGWCSAALAFLAAVPLGPGEAFAQPEPAAPTGLKTPPPSVELAADSVLVPFDASTGHIIVPVEVNGRGPYSFVLDTGAMGHGRVAPALVSELGLPVIGDARAADGTLKNTRRVDLVRIDSLRVGDATFRGLVAASVAMKRPPPAPDAPPPIERQGILGFGLFQDVLLTIDYPNSQLVIRRGALDPAAPHTVPLLGNLDIARIPIEVDLVELQAHVDTGNMGGFTVSTEILGRLKSVGESWVAGKARTLNNEFDVRAVRLAGPLQVADFRFDTTEASYVDIFRSANLGYTVLKNFALTFDQQNHLVLFAREAEGPLEALAKRATSGK